MITAVLITTEKEYPADILELIKKEPRITEILIKTESDSVWNRYLLAQEAKNNIIYTQDDDCYIDNIAELIDTFDGNYLVHNCQPSHYEFYTQKCQNRIALIGWGSVFSKDRLVAFQPYLQHYPCDQFFKMVCDRVFTWAIAPHRTIIRAIRQHENSNKPRMSTRPGQYHWQELDRIISRMYTL